MMKAKAKRKGKGKEIDLNQEYQGPANITPNERFLSTSKGS